MSFSVDTSVLDAKMKALNKKMPKIVPRLVMKAHDIVMKDVVKYVSGPYNPTGRGPGTGLVPIPRVSKRLAKSIQTQTSKTKETVTIISKGSIAPHNIEVHYGTKSKRARRFIEDPVSLNTIPIIQMWNRELYKELSK